MSEGGEAIPGVGFGIGTLYAILALYTAVKLAVIADARGRLTTSTQHGLHALAVLAASRAEMQLCFCLQAQTSVPPPHAILASGCH